MKKYNTIKMLSIGHPRGGRLLGLVMTALIFCFLSVSILPPVHNGWATETTQDAAATARQLQLEGSRLQLQGSLVEALKKYQESLALQPNPRLETLVQQLEQDTGKTATATTAAPAVAEQAQAPTAPGPTAPPVDPVGGEAQKVPVEVVLPGKETGRPAEPQIVKKQRIPGTPEEERIYAFTDWALSLFPHQTDKGNFSLKTSPDYAITQAGGHYEVRLEPFTLSLGENDRIELGPIVLAFTPQGREKVAVTLHLPKTAQLFTADKVAAELTIGSQEASGVWDRTFSGFDQSEVKLGDLAILDSTNKGRFDIKEIVLNSICSKNEQGLWDEKYRGLFSGFSFADDKTHLNLGKIAVLFNLGGSNFAKYAEVKKNFQRGINQGEALQLPELKRFLSSLDEYIQLLSVYTSSVAIQGVTVTSGGVSFTLDSIDMAGDIHKDGQSGRYRYGSSMEVKRGSFIEKQTPENPQPVSASLNSVGFVGKGTMKPMPPTMFADLFTTIEGFEHVKKEESDAYLTKQGTAFARKIMELIEGYSGEITLNGLNVVTAGPDPITIETAQFGGGFEVGTGEGGEIQTHINFAGLSGPAPGANNIPKSANFKFELKNIPSLLPLLPDPNSPAAGNLEQIQGQAVMKAMSTLMMSALTFSLTDSFVAFPASRIQLSVLANLDNKAKYFLTGNLQVAIENPDEFMRIAQSFGADPAVQKMLGTLTALASRSNESGKTVDKIDAKINQEGKVFINAKDVTSMFFPEVAPTQQGPPPQQPLPKSSPPKKAR